MSKLVDTYPLSPVEYLRAKAQRLRKQAEYNEHRAADEIKSAEHNAIRWREAAKELVEHAEDLEAAAVVLEAP